MNRGYEKALQRYEMEAQLVLKAHGLPTIASTLTKKNLPVRNHLVLYAQLVILGAYHLRKEIKMNRIHRALDRFLDICEAYGDMNVYSNADSFDKKLRFTDWEIYQCMNEGKKSLDNRRIAALLKNYKTQERSKEIQVFVDDNASKIKNPTWTKLKEIAAKKFRVCPRTIQNHANNPYKKN